MCICSLHYIRHASVTRDKGVSVGCGDTACQIQSKLIPVLFSDRSMKTGTTFFFMQSLALWPCYWNHKLDNIASNQRLYKFWEGACPHMAITRAPTHSELS
jgi:hypothetical protein